jgi:hypothetical protein
LQPNQSFVNELLLLISSFENRPDQWFLKEIISILKEADDDLKFTPPLQNAALRKFVSKDEEFNLKDARQLLLEVGDE